MGFGELVPPREARVHLDFFIDDFWPKSLQNSKLTPWWVCAQRSLKKSYCSGLYGLYDSDELAVTGI